MELLSVSIVRLGPINQAPVAQNQAVTTSEDTAKKINLIATDVDSTTLTYSIVAQPTHGSLSTVSGNRVTYTPAANYFGTDSFTFKANDGTSDSNTATVSITVTPDNDPPVAQNQSVETEEDTAKIITLVATDVDSTTLTYSIVAQPSHGSLSPVGGDKVVYTPAPNYFGSDSFTFKANDGTLNSNTATVTITVTAVNDPPIAQDQSVTTAEDTAKEITLVATDPDGDALTYIIVSQPQHGSLSTVSGNIVTYTPAANYFGPDGFTFKASDGSLDSNTATVTITVTAVNDPPVAQDQAVTTAEDTAKEITLVATDVENSPLTYSIVAQPQHGSLSAVSGNKVTYTPAANYSGADSFTFKANDGALDSNTATVSITVTDVNVAPVAQAQTVTTDEDTAKEITLLASDADGDPLTYTIVDQAEHGSLSLLSGNKLTYTPDENYNGPDSFSFKANDGTLDSNIATVSINVEPVNDAPVAFDQSRLAVAGETIEIELEALDIDGDLLEFIIVEDALHGTFELEGKILKYTPDPAFAGVDKFVFKANDGSLDSNLATVTITVRRTVTLYPYFLPMIFR
jgi:VCBS repeat-containing protein